MPQDRPRIPAETERELLIQSGHRCAVCGAELPLERAHIIPWSRSRDHSLANLLCLCANCHERADKEGWGETTLRQYKQRPWVIRARTEVIAGGVSTLNQPGLNETDFDVLPNQNSKAEPSPVPILKKLRKILLLVLIGSILMFAAWFFLQSVRVFKVKEEPVSVLVPPTIWEVEECCGT